MIKFWVEWLDGSLICEIEAENERQAMMRAENAVTGLGLEPGTFRIRAKAEQ